MTFDYTITAGNVLEACGFIIGGLYALASLKSTVRTLSRDVVQMQTEIKKIGDVVTNQAVHAQRILNLEQDFRDLRRGNGWIQGRGAPGVTGEYP